MSEESLIDDNEFDDNEFNYSFWIEQHRIMQEKSDVLQKKLDITMKALDDILEFKRTGYFGLNFDIWQIIQKAMAEIEKIK